MSAVLHSSVDCVNRPDHLGGDFSILHNPLAACPLNPSTFSWCDQYFYRDGTLEKRLASAGLEPAEGEAEGRCPRCKSEKLVQVKVRRYPPGLPVGLAVAAVVIFILVIATAAASGPLSPAAVRLFGNVEQLLVGASVATLFFKRSETRCPSCDGTASNQATRAQTLPSASGDSQPAVVPKRKRSLPIPEVIVFSIVLGMILFGWLFPVYRDKATRESLARSVEQGTVMQDLGFDRMDPYEFFARIYRVSGPSFAREIGTTFTTVMEKTNPGSSLTVERADAQDLGFAMCFRVGFRGTLMIEGQGLKPIVGEHRTYMHPGGSLVLDGICLSSVSQCTELASPMIGAETAILKRLTDAGVSNILPEHGRCSAESTRQGVREADVATCVYEDGTTISVTRQDLAETRRSLEIMTRDPAVKEILRNSLRSPSGR